ncbi:hypothetical protein CALVIDRAFT_533665 [Calocera viscosa TUFC12733]|uniref:Clathrin/coatomer adaptor adaptin-like N-terminal domain-containing protein n=1 Tax=Calocera viscosa (strain TUFC12733) TaxID=1330018 RepID=A0A167R844_CALVF|nr:hypothetical protein CALVIDRAFT_533665 [Calocera viscosa TUFC12733]
MALSNLQENAARLSARIQETIAERTRDMSFGKSPNAALFDTAEDKVKQIRKQLDSSQDREKLEAMKRLIAMISKGRNVSEFFAQVVKNVASSNLEIRKLVYIYLLRYADQEPDLALLSINTFQKDLGDSNPLIRAMALRVLSGIKVPVIGSIVALGIKKCATDMNPYVRKAAALAIPKCYSLDPTQHSALMSILSLLLREQSPIAVGSVAVAFDAICPDRLDLLHQHYRRLCRVMVDADEWGQINLLELLTRYARKMLNKPPEVVEKQEANETQDFLDEKDDGMDPDLDLLLDCAEPLFQSRNPAVVMAVVRLFYYCAPLTYRVKVVKPMLRLMHISSEIAGVVLGDLVLIAADEPKLLRDHIPRFLIRTTEPSHTKRRKLHLLVALLNEDNQSTLLREFKDCLRDTCDSVVVEAIHAIGRCARLVPTARDECLRALMGLMRSHHDVAVNAAVLVLKSLIISFATTDAAAATSLISRLALRLPRVKHAQARAAIIWLVGQYAADESSASLPANGHPDIPAGVARWAPDVLRQGAQTFAVEADPVKLQLITLAAKLVVLSPADNRLSLLSQYVLSLARYDSNYDVRDRARMIGSLLQGVNAKAAGSSVWSEEVVEESPGGVVLRKEQVRVVLFGGKVPPPDTSFGGDRHPDAVLGSLALILNKSVEGNRVLPEWPEEGTDSSLRETEEDRPMAQYAQATVKSMTGFGSGSMAAVPTPITLTPAGGSSPAGSAPHERRAEFTDLDKFYASESSEEEEDEDDEEEEEEETEEDEEVPQAPKPQPVAAPATGPWGGPEYDEVEDDSDEGEEEEEEGEEEEEEARSMPLLKPTGAAAMNWGASSVLAEERDPAGWGSTS